VDARSALFDLYGDHLRLRGGSAPVAALVRLLAPLGVQAPAVRTAVSRMVRQGWLTRADAVYALTPRAVRRLDEAADRIYRTSSVSFDGTWHLLVVTPPSARVIRERLYAQLQYLGYGALGGGTWLSPRPAPELDAVLSDAGARAERFTSVHDGDSQALIARAWDLDGLARSYTRFLDRPRADGSSDLAAFAARSELVHDWRKFLFVDPGLPAALLPPDWPGAKAAAEFDAEAARLLPAARRFVDECLSA
jgi:phenylacetic acid degradation operon negative regulatory protein